MKLLIPIFLYLFSLNSFASSSCQQLFSSRESIEVSPPGSLEKLTFKAARRYSVIQWSERRAPHWPGLKFYFKESTTFHDKFLDAVKGTVTDSFAIDRNYNAPESIRVFEKNEYVAPMFGTGMKELVLHSKNLSVSDKRLVELSVRNQKVPIEMMELRLLDELGNEIKFFEQAGKVGEINITTDDILSLSIDAVRKNPRFKSIRLVHTHPYESILLETPDGKTTLKSSPLSLEDIELTNEIIKRAPFFNFQVVAITGIRESDLTKLVYPFK